MRRFDFSETVDRKDTSSVKWDALKAFYGSDDLVPMWVADMDFRTPDAISEALARRAATGQFGYSFFGEREKQAIISWFDRRFNTSVSQEDLLYASGVVTALSHTILALTDEQDEIIIQTPVYPPFFQVVSDNGRTLVENELLLTKDGYVIDFSSLEEQMRTAKLILLCSPHNPVGRVWRKEELERIYRLAETYDVLVVSDEIHADLVFSESTHLPSIDFGRERTILISAPSKSFNIPGLYASFMIAPNVEHRKKIKAVQQRHFVHPNTFALVAFEAAYQSEDSEAWLDSLINYLEENRNHAVRRIRDEMPMLEVQVPEATYLLWIDFTALLPDIEERKLWLRDEAQVALTHGEPFGKTGESFERLNFGCPRQQLDLALDRLGLAYQKQIRDRI
ncbi:MalY/PatB family protein [Exiguobacterium flavidum]|uniref:MalY/PatB family protein n=1 Tax=Exiguobacterium flavidum TaxID=2184695 RepID=UPI000DF7E7B9|nr:MalY/PatB family protein [Exiguobacterium flavidum]